MAYMIDHEEDENGNMRVVFPQHTLNTIRKIVPALEFSFGDEPQSFDIEAFLCWFDISGGKRRNQGCKSDWTISSKKENQTNKGRTNTLLTYAYCIGAMLGRISVGDYAFGYQEIKGFFL